MPVLAAVSSSRVTARPLVTRKSATDSSSSRMPSALNLPTSAACRKRFAIRGITPQRPSPTQAESPRSGAPETMLDERAKTLLKTLVERYIADGQPVGSRTLSRASGLELSPATIRNVMADLEELGLIASPHTSAGRIPTARGYRLFVDTMLTARSLDADAMRSHLLEEAGVVREALHPDQPQRVIAQAASLLSNLSSFVGVV